VAGWTIAFLSILFLWSRFGELLPEYLEDGINIASDELPDRVDAVTAFLLENLPEIVALGFALLVLRLGLDLSRGPKKASIRPIPLRLAIIAFLLIAAATWFFTSWLLGIVESTPGATPGDIAKLQIDAIRTGLSAGAGTGGLLALLLAARRQWANEVSANETIEDASDRRASELYNKAVEQIGGTVEAVRLGGLYSLERLARDYPVYRQPVVSMLCAYLRSDQSLPELGESMKPRRSRVAKPLQSGNRRPGRHNRESRTAALDILADHLRYRATEESRAKHYWPDMEIDLSGVDLDAASFERLAVRRAVFDRAVFHGLADFRWADFYDASFKDCEFHDMATFARANFRRDPRFDSARFRRGADFQGARFTQRAFFRGCIWYDECNFAGASFTSGFLPSSVSRALGLELGNIAIRRIAGIREWAIERRFIVPSYTPRIFFPRAIFDDAKFKGSTDFTGVLAYGYLSFKRAAFTVVHFWGAAWWFHRSEFDDAIIANAADSVAPPEWSIAPTGGGRGVLVPADSLAIHSVGDAGPADTTGS
jgi:uncharacterized protein YjbI with pentapeptide repeats